MKITRKIFFPTIAAVALTISGGLSGCNSVLDVRNEGQLSNEAALATTDAVNTALNGCYDALQGTIGSGNPLNTTEALAGDVVYQGSDYGYLEIYNQNMSLFTPNNRNLWQTIYVGINSVNNVIDAAGKVTDAAMTESVRSSIRGQGLFLRGVLLFEGVRMWGQQWGFSADNSQPGMIIRTEPTRSASGAIKQRASVAETYAQIISDLTAAEAILPDVSASLNGKATKQAAQAYLARVYFQQNNFDKAYEYANKVIAGNKFALGATVREVFFTAYSKEAIFQIPVFTINNSFAALRGMYQKTRFGEPPFSVSDDMLSFASTLEASDARVAFLKKDGAKTFVAKYDTTISNVTTIRLAEMYLIRAESGAELGKPDAEVRADINILRTRAGATADNSTTGKQALLALCEKERRIELCYEGDRLHYLRRRKSTNIRGLAWNDTRLLAKIPDSEISGNPSVTLNP